MATPQDLANLCLNLAADLTLSQAEEEDVFDYVDHRHLLEEGKFSIDAVFYCDGPYSVSVFYEQKIVLFYDNDMVYNDGKERIEYKPGEWEKELIDWEKEMLKLYPVVNRDQIYR